MTKIEFNEIKNLSMDDLLIYCEKINLSKGGGKISLLSDILRFHIQNDDQVSFEGYLECINNSFGFLRDNNNNFFPCAYDIYVPGKLIKDCDLRHGDQVKCILTTPKAEQKFYATNNILLVNGKKPLHQRRFFESLTPCYPKKQIILEVPTGSAQNSAQSLVCRLTDLVTPIGFGQRALIVAQPKTGKTTIMHAIATSISKNHPHIKLIILLIDERPEEVTEMKKIVPGASIFFATFDESPENHIFVTEMVCELAKRHVEYGEDVIILMDSITRLTRSYNAIIPPSGKIMSGGLDPAALIKPKKFFGSARNLEQGGSLTIIATALSETGSKMDDFVYEEFKGTGNCEIKLTRELAERRLYPAIDIRGSGTRRFEEMFSDKNLLAMILALSSYLANLNNEEAVRFMIERIKHTSNNKELIVSTLKLN